MSDLLVNLIIQVIAGAFGGILAGNVMTNYSLGTTGNTLAGAVGGGVGGYVLTLLVPSLRIGKVTGTSFRYFIMPVVSSSTLIRSPNPNSPDAPSL